MCEIDTNLYGKLARLHLMHDRKLTLDLAEKTKKLTLLKKAKKQRKKEKNLKNVQVIAGGLGYNRRGYVHAGPRVSDTNITAGGSIRTAGGNICITYTWVPPLAYLLRLSPQIDKSRPRIPKSTRPKSTSPFRRAVACRHPFRRRRSLLPSLPLSPLALAPSSPRRRPPQVPD